MKARVILPVAACLVCVAGVVALAQIYQSQPVPQAAPPPATTNGSYIQVVTPGGASRVPNGQQYNYSTAVPVQTPGPAVNPVQSNRYQAPVQSGAPVQMQYVPPVQYSPAPQPGYGPPPQQYVSPQPQPRYVSPPPQPIQQAPAVPQMYDNAYYGPMSTQGYATYQPIPTKPKSSGWSDDGFPPGGVLGSVNYIRGVGGYLKGFLPAPWRGEQAPTFGAPQGSSEPSITFVPGG